MRLKTWVLVKQTNKTMFEKTSIDRARQGLERKAGARAGEGLKY